MVGAEEPVRLGHVHIDQPVHGRHAPVGPHRCGDQPTAGRAGPPPRRTGLWQVLVPVVWVQPSTRDTNLTACHNRGVAHPGLLIFTRLLHLRSGQAQPRPADQTVGTVPAGTVEGSGRSISFDEIRIDRHADGRIVESWWIPDRFTLWQQLGLLPAPPEPTAGSARPGLASRPARAARQAR
jgi:SnoaL-like polyketide cyclase